MTLEAVTQDGKRLATVEMTALRAARKAWKRVDPNNIEASWTLTSRDFIQLMGVLQAKAADIAVDYTVQALAEQGEYVEPHGFVDTFAFGGGYAPSGIRLNDYFRSPILGVLHAIKQGSPPVQALQFGLKQLGTLTVLLVDDTHRSAAGVSIAQRDGVGYVRVEAADCCSRCMILAGKYYRYNEGFLRHPHCHGRHLPVRGGEQAERAGWVTDPMRGFQALSREEQDRRFGKANAQAIRDGADIFQVVNSRRGIQGLGARKGRRSGTVFMTTTEGTTRYGWSRMLADQQGRTQKRRLTPEGIYALSRSREETIRLLEREGYIIASDWREKATEIRKGMWLHDNTYRQGRTVTQTAAQRRLENARLRYMAALDGRNPYDTSKPVTPEVLARAERNFRRWLSTGGEIYTN